MFERLGAVRQQIAGKQPLQQVGAEGAEKHRAEEILLDHALSTDRIAVARAAELLGLFRLVRDQPLIDRRAERAARYRADREQGIMERATRLSRFAESVFQRPED